MARRLALGCLSIFFALGVLVAAWHFIVPCLEDLTEESLVQGAQEDSVRLEFGSFAFGTGQLLAERIRITPPVPLLAFYLDSAQANPKWSSILTDTPLIRFRGKGHGGSFDGTLQLDSQFEPQLLSLNVHSFLLDTFPWFGLGGVKNGKLNLHTENLELGAPVPQADSLQVNLWGLQKSRNTSLLGVYIPAFQDGELSARIERLPDSSYNIAAQSHSSLGEIQVSGRLWFEPGHITAKFGLKGTATLSKEGEMRRNEGCRELKIECLESSSYEFAYSSDSQRLDITPTTGFE